VKAICGDEMIDRVFGGAYKGSVVSFVFIRFITVALLSRRATLK
jgi:hypothetical protein